MSENQANSRRGRSATKPTEIPWFGWYDIVRRTWIATQQNNLGLIAAGIAFYCLLALFPALSSLIAISGLLFFDQDRLISQLATISEIFPEETKEIISSQVQALARIGDGSLSLAAVAGLAISILSASRGIGALIGGLNAAYGEIEDRTFLKQLGLNLIFTVGLLLGLLITLVVAAALPALLTQITLELLPSDFVSSASMVILAFLFASSLSVLYRFGPSRREARWKWISVGSILATAVFLLVSWNFAYFVSNFGRFNESFGSLAGVVVLLIWLWLSAFIVLIGAALNGEIEAQTRIDSTVGKPKPMGSRGAVKADHLGRSFD